MNEFKRLFFPGVRCAKSGRLTNFTWFKLVLLATLLTACGSDKQQSIELELRQVMPDLGETSDQPVTLKYKYVVGQSVRAKVEISVKSLSRFGERYQANQAGKIGTKMISADIEYKVRSVDNKNNGEVLFAITGVRFFSSSGTGQHYFNSDNKRLAKTADMAVLSLLKDAPIKLTVSELGEIKKRDFTQLKLKAKQANLSYQYKQLHKIVNQIINEVFLPLPTKIVKIGAVVPAGNEIVNISGFKEYKTKLMYRIKAVSNNKKLVLLEPIVDFDLVKNGEKINIIESRQKTWRLFDLENGRFARSSADNKYKLKVKLLDAAATIELSSQSSFSVVD